MSKKRYIFSILTGSLLFLLVLPVINYRHDQWRVLHQDFAHAYDGIAINKSYLKTAYLLQHPNRYDTLLFGSSRNGAFVETDIASYAYNAYADFGVIGQHLHNLKILLAHGMHVKEVWIGINDFDIWKDPKDFETDYSKRVYPENIQDIFEFYRLYLFKHFDNNDLAIMQGKLRLVPSNRIYRKALEEHKQSLIDREKSLIGKGMQWRKKLTSMAATLLGYNDDPKQYRIDQTIEEIREIKELCRKHHIKTVFFFYPAFYKTFLMYNQSRIASFKRKLAKVTDFYDFYRLDMFAMDEMQWSDTSHFVYSVAEEIIQDIKHKKYLVTHKNCETVLREERKAFSLLLHKTLPIKFIMRFQSSITPVDATVLYDIKQDVYRPNEQIKIVDGTDDIQLKSLGSDPFLVFNPVVSHTDNVIMHCEITSESKTLFQLFYKVRHEEHFNEKHAINFGLDKGMNSFNLLIPSDWVKYGFRIDPGQRQGLYVMRQMQIFGE